MIRKILITYFTESGSTCQAAEIIGKQLKETKHLQVDTCDVENVSTVIEYDLVIIGTPNWYGKPAPKIQDFLKTHQIALKNTLTAMFYTCMSLSETSNDTFKSIPIFKDPVLESTPKVLKDMSMWEKSHVISYYLINLKKVAPEFSPCALAFFKGNLDFSKLSFFHRMVMKFITLINTEVKEGDYLSQEALQKWAASQLFPIIVKEKT